MSMNGSAQFQSESPNTPHASGDAGQFLDLPVLWVGQNPLGDVKDNLGPKALLGLGFRD